jgi:hypothetical protein
MTGMKKRNLHTDQTEPEELLRRFLTENPGNEPFKVPEGYFDRLPGRIRDEIVSKTSGKFNPFSFRSFFTVRRVWVPVLAIAVVCIVVYFLLPYPERTQQSLVENKDTLNMSTGYDASYAGEALLDEYASISKMIEESSLTQDADISFITTSNDGITNEDICDYLQEQELDSDVIAELQIDLPTNL